MSKHRAEPVITQQETTTSETWGLLMPDGRILLQGYSERSFTSADDVLKDFDRSVIDRSVQPVLLSQTVTHHYRYRPAVTQ